MNTLLVIANFVLAALNVVLSVGLTGASNIVGGPELVGYVFGGRTICPLVNRWNDGAFARQQK